MDQDIFKLIHETPLIDHHCHFLINDASKNRETRLVNVSTEADSSYPLSDTKERTAWWAFKNESKKFLKTDDIESLSASQYIKFNHALFKNYNFKLLMIDTGFVPDDAIESEKKTEELTGIKVKKIFRIETCAEKCMLQNKNFFDWWESLKQNIVQAKANGFVGFKSIAAYRTGLCIKKTSVAEAESAFYDWKKSKVSRLTDAILINFILWNIASTIIEQNMPLQFHVGYGDADADLYKANPLLMRDFLRTWCCQGLNVVLLHCYPYHKEAGYLASVYPNVYFDTSLVNALAPTSTKEVLNEALHLAPYSRYLFASDASTYPEMYGVAAATFESALAIHFKELDFVPYSQKEKWINEICYLNSMNLYNLKK